MSDAAKTEEVKFLSLEDLENPEVDGCEYDTVQAYGGHVCIGSLPSDFMLSWLESNADPAQDARKVGLRLIVRSLVDVKTHARIPEADWPKWMTILGKKDSANNGKVVKAILKLNGIGKAASEKMLADVKNESGETAASTVVSPSDSPVTSVE